MGDTQYRYPTYDRVGWGWRMPGCDSRDASGGALYGGKEWRNHLFAHEFQQILDVKEVGGQDCLENDLVALLLELLVKSVDDLPGYNER